MNSLLESSFICKSISAINKFLTLVYSTSFLKRISDTIKLWFSHSAINRFIQNYLNRGSYAEKSVTYGLISTIGKGLDIPVGKFGGFILSQLKTSTFVRFINKVKEEFPKNPGIMAIIFIIPFITGFILVTTVRNLWSPGKIIYILLLALVGAVCLAVSVRLKPWFKNSIIYKLCHNIWE